MGPYDKNELRIALYCMIAYNSNIQRNSEEIAYNSKKNIFREGP